MTIKTILNVSNDSVRSQETGAVLRNAGFSVVEMHDWRAAAAALQNGDASLVVCDGEAFSALAEAGSSGAGDSVPRELARSLSHDLRTPLSAMAGWLHLMESGKLDEAGLKRAIGKLRGNIDEQVKTIERFLGAAQERNR